MKRFINSHELMPVVGSIIRKGDEFKDDNEKWYPVPDKEIPAVEILLNGYERLKVNPSHVETMANTMAYMGDNPTMTGVYDQLFNTLFMNYGERYAVAVVDAAAETLISEF